MLMKDESYLLKLARRCRDLEKTAIAPEVIEHSEFGQLSWPEWPKTLSSELFSPIWLSDLSRTEQGAPHCQVKALWTQTMEHGSTSHCRDRVLPFSKTGAICWGTEGSNPSPSS